MLFEVDEDLFGEEFNTISELMDYFSIPEKWVSKIEFMTFWRSCSMDEKAYFRTVALA